MRIVCNLNPIWRNCVSTKEPCDHVHTLTHNCQCQCGLAELIILHLGRCIVCVPALHKAIVVSLEGVTKAPSPDERFNRFWVYRVTQVKVHQTRREKELINILSALDYIYSFYEF